MGAIEDVESRIMNGTAPDHFDARLHLHDQVDWARFQNNYVSRIHPEWWQQIPMGHVIEKLVPFEHSHTAIAEYLNELFKIEPVGNSKSLPEKQVQFVLMAFKEWVFVAKALGFMLLSVPYGAEINGPLKKKYLEIYGIDDQLMSRLASEKQYQKFYQLTTYRNLRMLLRESSEHMLQQLGFEAWSLISLVLPKGITQRIHLSLPPDWVSDIQRMRNKFLERDQQQLKGVMDALLMVIADGVIAMDHAHQVIT